MVFRYLNKPYPIQQLRSDMDRLLSSLVGRSAGALWPALERGQPPNNVWEDGDTLIVELEVPGLNAEQIDMSVGVGELTVRAEYPDRQPEGAVYHRRERPRGDFERTLRLPADVDTNRVEAALADGVLSISLPKAESAKARRINVVSR